MFQSAVDVFKVFTEIIKDAVKAKKCKMFYQHSFCYLFTKYCLYRGMISNQFRKYASKDPCNCTNLKNCYHISAYVTCTPERGLRQKRCLIYRLEGVFKLFLPYGLEHMGVPFHAKATL